MLCFLHWKHPRERVRMCTQQSTKISITYISLEFILSSVLYTCRGAWALPVTMLVCVVPRPCTWLFPPHTPACMTYIPIDVRYSIEQAGNLAYTHIHSHYNRILMSWSTGTRPMKITCSLPRMSVKCTYNNFLSSSKTIYVPKPPRDMFAIFCTYRASFSKFIDRPNETVNRCFIKILNVLSWFMTEDDFNIFSY